MKPASSHRRMPGPGQALALVLLVHVLGWGVDFNAARITSPDWAPLIAKTFYVCCGFFLVSAGWLLPGHARKLSPRELTVGTVGMLLYVTASCSALLWMASQDPDLSTSIIPAQALLTQVVLAPIAEELIFTGFLFSALRMKFGFRGSALAIACLFTLLHWPTSVISLSMRLIYMLVACSIYERFRSVFVTIAFHILLNGALLTEVILVEDASSPVFKAAPLAPGLMVACLLMALVLAGSLVTRELRDSQGLRAA